MGDVDLEYIPDENTENDEEIVDAHDKSLSLQTVRKSKSNSEVWKYYGKLLKCGSAVKKLADKYFCKLCFDRNILKR